MPGAKRAHASWPLLDVAAWAAVAITTLMTVGLALIAVSAIDPAEMPFIGGATALLVGAAGFAATRHLRAVHRAEDAVIGMMQARDEELAARDRLSFARHAAATMASMPQGEGLRAVLTESLARFAAHAAAVVGDDMVLVTAERANETQARTAVTNLAAQTAKSGRSVTFADRESATAALTAPLRIRGEMQGALVLWRRGHAFRTDDLDGLSMVARIVELSMENTTLVREVRDQLSGTLHMMIDLVEQRLPDYGAHAERVSAYAVALGEQMGLDEDGVEVLRTAGLLHDVGMLAVPESILNTPRRLTPEEMTELHEHPGRGAELTREAAFPKGVQEAIRSHHENVDGSGYPAGLSGDEIPLAGRILAVSDAYVALISDRPHRPRVSTTEAVGILRSGAGTRYDRDVVDGFVAAEASNSEA